MNATQKRLERERQEARDLDRQICASEAGSDEQIDLICKEFHLKIHRYLKRGYWSYVEESLRSAITKARGEWPGQKPSEGFITCHECHGIYQPSVRSEFCPHAAKGTAQ